METYYERNKLKKLSYAKKYREEHKKELNEYAKKIRDEHKDYYENYRKLNNSRVNIYLKEKITCECGAVICRRYKSGHCKTQKHLLQLESLKISQTI